MRRAASVPPRTCTSATGPATRTGPRPRPSLRGGPRRRQVPACRREQETVTGGLIRRVSPAMIHAYFDYITTEYPGQPGHQMLLVQLHGERAGQPWAPDAARRMLARAGRRAGLGVVRPHAFRHS